jgi:hypothetical protein
MNYNAKIWGPHYWFVLHTMAQTYPLHPTQTTKRKYYEFFMNLPLFLPDENMGNQFQVLLDTFPLSPYLGSRDDLVKWTHFIHNKINVRTGKPEVSLVESLDRYKQQYRVMPIVSSFESSYNRKQIMFWGTCVSAVLLFIYFSQRSGKK